MTKILILFLLFFQDGELISTSSSVSRNVVKIGDKIQYTIRIEYDNSLEIQTPGQGVNLGYFEVKDYQIKASEELGNRTREIFQYTISTYDTGHYVIPPYPVGYFKKGQKESFKLIEAPEQQLYVKSIFLNDSIVNEQPRDIKTTIDIPYTSYWWLWLIGVLLFLFIVYLLYLRFFKKEAVAIEEKITPLQAHEIAILELNKIANFTSDNLDEISAYYTQLSLILRRYLENRFEISAAEETTTELKESLKEINISSAHYDWIMELVSYADLVKFAKELPQEADFQRVHQEIMDFVLSTKLEKALEEPTE